MSYREPGVYVKQERNARFNIGTTPALIPVIVGKGLKEIKTQVAVTRGSGNSDTLPFASVASIFRVGNTRTSSDYTLTTDYTLAAPNIISWAPTGNEPAAGAVYHVTLSYNVQDDYYVPTFVSTRDEVVAKYGPDVTDGGVVNPVSLGAQIALEGSRLVIAIAVNYSGADVTATDYETVFERHLKHLPAAYRIIPMDLRADILLRTIGHVNVMSTPDERMERVTIIGADHASPDFTSVLANVGGYADSLDNERVMVIYPDRATRILSDGKVYTLSAPYICAAMAGWKASQPTERAFTRGDLTSFSDLVGVKMTRSQKNLLAARGVTVLEQVHGPGTPIEVRHGITTNMVSVQTREPSVVEIADYTSKYLRSGLSDSYIGKENITPSLIAKVKASTNSLLSVLAKMGTIIAGEIVSMYQDSASPDTLVMRVRIAVPYPCNYIEITLFLD